MVNTLRLALAFNEINSSKFDVILYNVISSILFLKEYANGLSKEEIKNSIKKELDLSFSTLEVEQSIKKENLKRQYIDYSNSEKKYALSEKGINHFKNSNESELDACIDCFVEENKEQFANKLKKEEIKKAITDLLVLIFNSNKDELLYLLNNKRPRNSGAIDKLSPKNKELATAFFNWNNAKKDDLVFKMIKASCDYCALSLKKDANDLSNGLFAKKSFCLDSNVIFAAIGINGQENQNATLAFIELCKQNNINICYFNYTKEEIVDTLHGIISSFARGNNSGGYLDEQTIGRVFAKTRYGIVYKLYKEWLRKPGPDKNYSGFEKHLRKEIDYFLSDFKLILIDEEEISKNIENIEALRNELYSFKNSRAKHHISLSNHDAICYYYMKKQCGKYAPTVKDQRLFFVTFDRLLCEWSIGKAVGRISAIISVNVMYSLLLKISGRTDDDAKSFSEFLSMNLSNAYYDNDKSDIKAELLCVVDEMERSDEAKKQIFVLANSLLEKNPSSFVSSSEPISKKAGNLAKKAEETFDDILNADTEKRINLVAKEGEEKAKAEYNKGLEEGIAKGKEEQRIQSISKRNYFIRIVLAIIIGLFTIVFIALSIISFAKEGVKNFWGWVSAISTLAGLVGFPCYLIKIVVYKESKTFLPVDNQHIRETYSKKISNKEKQ